MHLAVSDSASPGPSEGSSLLAAGPPPAAPVTDRTLGLSHVQGGGCSRGPRAQWATPSSARWATCSESQISADRVVSPGPQTRHTPLQAALLRGLGMDGLSLRKLGRSPATRVLRTMLSLRTPGRCTRVPHPRVTRMS